MSGSIRTSVLLKSSDGATSSLSSWSGGDAGEDGGGRGGDGVWGSVDPSVLLFDVDVASCALSRNGSINVSPHTTTKIEILK